MGLSGGKTKTKISRDPNNNGWATSTSRFGHKILTSQGWTPGSYLGAKDAAQSGHFTAANASHIRVLLKDDNLGLGAKRGAKADTFGLSTLQGIFGRLNGKSEEDVARVEKVQRDGELARWQSSRFGYVQFVSGGFLVGDSIRRLKSEKSRDSESGAKIEISAIQVSKKRKRDGDAGAKSSTTKRRRAAVGNADSVEPALPATDGSEEDEKSPSSSEETIETLDKRKRKEERRKRKEEKQQRKLERQARREAKAQRREKRRQAAEGQQESTEDVPSSGSDSAVVELQTATTAAATPVGRHAVRSRYIRQKRMAMTDAKALNEILMIKAQG